MSKQASKQATSGCVIFALLLLSSVLMGATCSPTERPCNNQGECDGETEYPACIQFCVENLSREDGLGQTCVVDPCHEDLVTHGTAILCPDGLTCLSIDGEHGQCVDVAHPFLASCQPGPVYTCATGTFCRPFEDQGCPGGPVRPSSAYYADWDGVCTTPIREGGFCDANWGQQGCRVCEPGTACTPDPLRGGSLRCRRPCDEDDDCPCVAGVDPSVCLGDLDPGDEVMDGFCSVCVAHRDECEFREPDAEMDTLCAMFPTEGNCPEWLSQTPYGCCDPDDECRRVPVGGGPFPSLDVGFCCSTVSTECETNDDCCPGTVCSLLDNTCQPCDGLGEEEEDGCCPRLENRGDGVCRPECDLDLVGDPCSRPTCSGIDTVWECSDEVGMICVPAPGEPIGTDDNCDGIDNDCDGPIDEGWEPMDPECEFEDELCPSRAFDGVLECRRGTVVCVAAEEYCAYDYTPGVRRLVRGNYSACGQGIRDCETDGHSVCPPNSYCRPNDCWTDPMGMSFYGCWPHGMPYGCIGDDWGSDQECNSGVLCWTPDEFNTTGFTCPTS